MSCALTQGYSNDCKDSVGGASLAHVIETANVSAITVTAGVVTGITKATGKRFWKYKPARETLSAKSTLTTSPENGTTFWAQEVAMSLNKMQTNTRLEIQKLAQNNVYFVITDANGKHWLYGYKNGMDTGGGESGTGAKAADRNGYTINFKSDEPEDCIEVDDTTYGALETPGS